MYKISFKRTEEKAPVLYASSGASECLLDYSESGKPFLPGYDYALSLYGSHDVWMRTLSTRYTAEYGGVDKIGISAAASVIAPTVEYKSVNDELDCVTAIDNTEFLNQLVRERQSGANVAHFLTFVNTENSGSQLETVYKSFGEHGIFYAVPILRQYFLNCILSANAEMGGGSGSEAARDFCSRVIAVTSASTLEEIEKLDVRIGITAKTFGELAPYIRQASYDTQASNDDKIYSALLNLKLLTLFVPMTRYGDAVFEVVEELVNKDRRIKKFVAENEGFDALELFY